jgi:hypothetical protein
MRFAVPLLVIAGAAILAAFGTVALLLPETANAQAAARVALPPDAWTWGLLSAAFATAASSLAGGYAVA